nr:putative 57 kDa heat shock protein [Quercus suber]POE55101.1 putative 57 kda heat shock protein [Quercus suber]
MASSSSTSPNQSPPKPDGPYFSDFGITDSGGLYATNNPFQRSGPIDAVERIALANHDKLYMRVDMPGVPKENMHYSLDADNNVFFGGLAPKEWEHDDQEREYGGFIGLRCGCCRVKKLHGSISNGVLRMTMSKKKLKNMKNNNTCCTHGPHHVDSSMPQSDEDSAEDKPGRLCAAFHPFQTKGPKESYGAKEVKDGFYVWVDMPGVTKDKVSVGVENAHVLFSGEAGKESYHEESGRTYKGRFGPFDAKKIGDIKTDVKNGVLRMFIPAIGEE